MVGQSSINGCSLAFGLTFPSLLLERLERTTIEDTDQPSVHHSQPLIGWKEEPSDRPFGRMAGATNRTGAPDRAHLPFQVATFPSPCDLGP